MNLFDTANLIPLKVEETSWVNSDYSDVFP